MCFYDREVRRGEARKRERVMGDEGKGDKGTRRGEDRREMNIGD